MVKRIRIIEGLTNYLLKNGYAESSIKIHTDRIKNLIKKHTAKVLIENLPSITKSYYDGGINYNYKDHGNTAAALQQLKNYILFERKNIRVAS